MVYLCFFSNGQRVFAGKLNSDRPFWPILKLTRSNPTRFDGLPNPHRDTFSFSYHTFEFVLVQVFEPSIQKRRLSYVKHEHLVVDILKHLQEHTAEKILTEDGLANLPAIKGFVSFSISFSKIYFYWYRDSFRIKLYTRLQFVYKDWSRWWCKHIVSRAQTTSPRYQIQTINLGQRANNWTSDERIWLWWRQKSNSWRVHR